MVTSPDGPVIGQVKQLFFTINLIQQFLDVDTHLANKTIAVEFSACLELEVEGEAALQGVHAVNSERFGVLVEDGYRLLQEDVVAAFDNGNVGDSGWTLRIQVLD